MNVTRRIVVFGSMIVAINACSVWAADAPVDGSAKIYAAKCASCHAKDARGNPAMAKVFKVEPEKLSLVSEASLAKTDADLIKVITDGSGKMPSYKGKLTDAEIKDQIVYIRSLAPAKK